MEGGRVGGTQRQDGRRREGAEGQIEILDEHSSTDPVTDTTWGLCADHATVQTTVVWRHCCGLGVTSCVRPSTANVSIML